jgi:hypothetical protein
MVTRNLLIYFLVASNFLVLLFSPASYADGPSDPLGKAIFDSLDCPASHFDPGKAYGDLLWELEQLGENISPTAHKIYGQEYSTRLRDVPGDLLRFYIDKQPWFDHTTKEIRAFALPNVIADRPPSPMIQWLTDRSYYGTLVEEALHAWQNRVGIDEALKYTPRYAQYLKETGLHFDAEAHVYAVFEEKGRRMPKFEVDFHECSRTPYQEWLKKNGGIKKIPKCGEFTPSVRATLNVTEGPRVLDGVVDKILNASNRPNLRAPRLPTVLPVADMLLAATCSPELQEAAGDYCMRTASNLAAMPTTVVPSGPLKGIPILAPNLPARIFLNTMNGMESFSKNCPNTTHLITAPFQIMDYMFVAPVRHYIWGPPKPFPGWPQVPSA